MSPIIHERNSILYFIISLFHVFLQPNRSANCTKFQRTVEAGTFEKRRNLRKMATITVASTLSSSLRIKQARCLRCSASYRDGGENTPPLIKIAVEGVTQILGVFSSRRKLRESLSRNGGEAYQPSSVDDVVGVIRDEYQRAYFLTGNFTPDIYKEDCLFEDPTIKFRGTARYSHNLELLVPFFDTPSLELEEIEKGFNYERNYILATWKLRTYLKLPWRPLIAIRGKTTYDLDIDFKIIRHAESWNVSALEAIGQIFTFSSREIDL